MPESIRTSALDALTQEPSSPPARSSRLLSQRLPPPSGDERLASRGLLSLPSVRDLSPGLVDVSSLLAQVDHGLGILVVEGFLVAKLSVGRAVIGWLVGRDDLILTTQLDPIALKLATEWRVLRAARVALIDQSVCQRAASSRTLTTRLLTRAAWTTHWLLAKSLIASSPLLRERLMLLFALFAERWGTVVAEGVWIDIPLTHEVVANLCGASRPPVTVALNTLRSEGLLERTPGAGWLLRREPDETTARVSNCFSDYSDALAMALSDQTPRSGNGGHARPAGDGDF